MYFIPENYTFIEAVFMFLTEPIVIAAGILTFIATTLLSAHHMNNKPDPSLFKTWTVSPVLGIISGILISLIFALALTYLYDLNKVKKGHYEATGTIEKIEYRTEYAGETDGEMTISLKLDNGDPVDIQIPLQSPESIEPRDTFTLKSETQFNVKDDFIPIEKLYYSPEHQSLSSGQFPDLQFTIHFIVDGKVMKGVSN